MLPPLNKNLISKCLLFSAMLISTGLMAQSTGITRTILVRTDSSTPGKEDMIAKIEIAPGAVVDWHTHFGDEMSYVTEGEVELFVANQPPRKVKHGEAFVIPAGVVHSAKNHGSNAVRLVGVYVVDKDKPLATPASLPTP